MIIGADDALPREGSLDEKFDYFNSSFLISPGSELETVYPGSAAGCLRQYAPLAKWIHRFDICCRLGRVFRRATPAFPFRCRT
jgi:hypothetical protein